MTKSYHLVEFLQIILITIYNFPTPDLPEINSLAQQGYRKQNTKANIYHSHNKERSLP